MAKEAFSTSTQVCPKCQKQSLVFDRASKSLVCSSCGFKASLQK